MSDLMTVLVVGAGGREHALAWALSHSPRVGRVIVAPGNGGTTGPLAESAGIESVAIRDTDIGALVELAQQRGVDLTVVGPEAPLAAGIVDTFTTHGLRCFGPTREPAQLEASKAFSKHFMRDCGIPTARFEVFTECDRALDHARSLDYPFVVKASGLAGGKGVLLPETAAEAVDALRRLMVDRELGAAGEAVVIEERLQGREVSVLAFCDGTHAAVMPPAQDHKRLSDGDRGPNTGGMGAFAPSGLSPVEMEELTALAIHPVLDGMRERGTPYVGVLYAGIMLTPDGPRVLEYNCRFGDPEAQVLLPLLETDLTDVLLACIEGRLDEQPVRWREGAAATVVAASEGYPAKAVVGRTIDGIEAAAREPGVMVFQAGTRREGEALLTSGGRVLSVTGTGATVRQAVEKAYGAVSKISFGNMQFRTDIGASALGATYAAAGVDIAAGARAVDLMKDAVRATYGPEVLAGIGAFGGLFDISALKLLDHPVLVASTDGVGTKTKVASALGRWNTVGQDIVNHCIDDILVQGARPLFFLDYIAAGRLDPAMVAAVVGGAALACKAAGCALLGGETAEMPGVYAEGEFDLVGTIIGVVDKARVIDGSTIAPGDVVVGLASAGLHTNGFSLARRVLASHDLRAHVDELGGTLGDALLEPHRSYLPQIERLWAAGVKIKGLAHITGGGLVDNPPRILPLDVAMHIDRSAWPVPPLFRLIQRAGRIDEDEMAHVFNMGLGLLVVVPEHEAEATRALCEAEGAWIVGHIAERDGAPVVLS